MGKKTRFRVLMPAAYALLVVVLFLGHAQGAGHGKSLEFIPYISFPAEQIVEWFFGEIESLSGFLAVAVASLGQWFLVGYLLDTIVRKSTRHSA